MVVSGKGWSIKTPNPGVNRIEYYLTITSRDGKKTLGIKLFNYQGMVIQALREAGIPGFLRLAEVLASQPGHTYWKKVCSWASDFLASPKSDDSSN